MGPRAAQMEPKWRQDGVKTVKKQEKRANAEEKVGGVPRRRLILIEHGANMTPTWASKWSQDAQKIDPNIDHFFDASRDRFLN